MSNSSFIELNNEYFIDVSKISFVQKASQKLMYITVSKKIYTLIFNTEASRDKNYEILKNSIICHPNNLKKIQEDFNQLESALKGKK